MCVSITINNQYLAETCTRFDIAAIIHYNYYSVSVYRFESVLFTLNIALPPLVGEEYTTIIGNIQAQ